MTDTIDTASVAKSKNDFDAIHLLVGHDQIKNCKEITFNNYELNFSMKGIGIFNTSPNDFLAFMENEIIESKLPMKISALR